MEILLIIAAIVFCVLTYVIGHKQGLNEQISAVELTNQEILQERNLLYEEIQGLTQKVNNLNIEYGVQENNLLVQIQELQQNLDSMSRQKAATIEILQKEAAIKDEIKLYQLTVSQDNLQDIKLLRSIQYKLSNPRVLSMLIWQTFYQPIAKKKFPLILGAKTICGIYKITNQKNQKVYVGQAVDIYKRWNQHAKHACGIDTPQGNKLYAAMLEDGLENFSFELIEECPREELNKKEAYYISLYNSVQYGYNSTKGNING